MTLWHDDAFIGVRHDDPMPSTNFFCANYRDSFWLAIHSNVPRGIVVASAESESLRFRLRARLQSGVERRSRARAPSASSPRFITPMKHNAKAKFG